ncbi:hypothetical protein B7463_g2084, partial [Scytalidium lignicola]
MTGNRHIPFLSCCISLAAPIFSVPARSILSYRSTSLIPKAAEMRRHTSFMDNMGAMNGLNGHSYVDLWYGYATELKNIFVPSGELDNDLSIYVAPLTSASITIGPGVPEAITNCDIHRLGDMLLPPHSPIFSPGSSYSRRLYRHLRSVPFVSVFAGVSYRDVKKLTSAQSTGSQNQEVLYDLENARVRHMDATNRFLDCRREAFAKYLQDPEVPKYQFEDWHRSFYTPYQTAKFEMELAMQTFLEIAAAYYGEHAWDLWATKEKLIRALSGKIDFPYNMETSSQQITKEQVLNPSATELDPKHISYVPSYTIDSSFRVLTDNWIKTANDPGNRSFEIKFRVSSSPQGANLGAPKWDDLGFDHGAPHDQLVLTTNFNAGHGQQSENFGLDHKSHNGLQHGYEDGEREITVTLSASNAKVFSINPGIWDLPDFAKEYPVIRDPSSSDLRDSLVQVTRVLLGYRVELLVQTDQHFYSKLSNGLKTVQEYHGSANLLGVDIAPEATPSTVSFDEIKTDDNNYTICIPARDDTQLTLMGLMGKKLKIPENPTSEQN